MVQGKGHVDVQVKLSKNLIFDAYLIRARIEYRETHGRKLNALFSKLIADDMQDRTSSQNIVLPSLGRFTIKITKDKRISLIVTDAEQVRFLEEEIQGVMLYSEYAKKLFLQHFYGESEGVAERKEVSEVQEDTGLVLPNAPKEKKVTKTQKTIISPKAYVKKKVVQKDVVTDVVPSWINLK